MFKPYEIFIGLRYLRAKRRNHFISVISLISMLGIAVGVAALITVISVMNGFETELRERILSMTSHATITNEAYQLGNWTEVVDTAERHERVIGAAPYVRGEAMLSHSGELSGALVRGVDPDEESKVSEIADNMVVGTLGDLIPGEYGVVLGSELALMLNVYVGDKIVMMISQGNVTPAGIVPRLRRFTVTGIFEVGMAQYDNGLAIINIEDASRLFGLQGDVSGVRLKLDDMFYASRVVREVAYELGDTYYVSDWTRQHTNLFRAIKT
ncbi:MAG: ABC transporter permease, partial [Gammaproteobacteria bacterium]|nr:ABC transporter permease [Gammaproteobacteria bacterium]